MEVWAVESGAYEERRVERLFATQELAEEYIRDRGLRGEEPVAFEVWDRLPLPVTHYLWSAIFAKHNVTAEQCGYITEGDWLIQRGGYAGYEDGKPTESRVDYWNRKVSSIFVEVSGESLEEVAHEFDRLRVAIAAGELTPA